MKKLRKLMMATAIIATFALMSGCGKTQAVEVTTQEQAVEADTEQATEATTQEQAVEADTEQEAVEANEAVEPEDGKAKVVYEGEIYTIEKQGATYYITPPDGITEKYTMTEDIEFGKVFQFEELSMEWKAAVATSRQH